MQDQPGSEQLRSCSIWAGCFFFYHTEAERVNYTSQIQITQPRPITDGLAKKHDSRAKGKEVSGGVSGGDLSGMHGIFPT